MMNIKPKQYVCSDHHFGQESFYKYNEKRQTVLRPEFSCAEEADAEIVYRHNTIVPEFGSTVYFLGDIAKNITKAEYYISQMHGERKILIAGNHDSKYVSAKLLRLFDKILGCMYLGKKDLVLTHMPVHPAELFGSINLHGHLHRTILQDARYLNCCLEPNNYYPLSLDKIFC